MAINVGNIVQLIAAIPQLIDTVNDIVDGVRGAISAEDAKTLDAALATIQKQNDEGYARVRQKLQQAAQVQQ